MAKICANHKNLPHLRAKKQIAAFGRAAHKCQDFLAKPMVSGAVQCEHVWQGRNYQNRSGIKFWRMLKFFI
jgi:hypothetical protein